jgi:hypothetical protein
MSDNDVAGSRVIEVLLADGWHRIVPGSFSVGPMGFGAHADLGMPGFRFEEANAGSPYRPTVLAGPLDSIVAVRQVISAARPVGDLALERAASNGLRADPVRHPPIRAARRPAGGRWQAV